jgi:hypothetical protein
VVEQDFGAAGRWNQPPLGVGAAGGVHGPLDVVPGRFLKRADKIVGAGRISVFEHVGGNRWHQIPSTKL